MILLLSDLHLPPEPSPLRDAFLQFLAGPARAAQTVYLLGDLFESWIGDDIGLELYAPEVEALAALTASGVAVYYQHGNRDFMLGKVFAQRSGAVWLDDPVVVPLAGVATLLSHGDLFCTDDRTYQRWRRFSRWPLSQWLFLRLPRARRRRIAQGLRGGSRNKPESILDVNAGAIEAAFQRFGVQHMIHGHTHRPAVHELNIDGRICIRTVLPDWRESRQDWLRLPARHSVP